MFTRRQSGTRWAPWVAFALTWLVAGVPAALAIDPSPTAVPLATSTLVTASPNLQTEGSPIILTASVTPNPGTGAITWTADLQTIGASPVDASTGMATLMVTLGLGVHQIQAAFGGNTGFAPSGSPTTFVPVVTAGSPTISTIGTATLSAEEHAGTILTATVSPAFAGFMTFVDESAASPAPVVLGYAATDTNTGVSSLRVSLSGVGDHQIVAMDFGDGVHAGSVSQPVTVTVTPDVHLLASGFGLSVSAFYPYKDGYRDTVAARGTLGERATVTISIYSPSGSKVRVFALAAGPGTYSVAWNGRSTSGVLQGPGTYKVVQKVRDQAGNLNTVATNVVLSTKRLYWKTAAQTRRGSVIDNYDNSEFGFVTFVSRYAGGVFISGNIYDQYADVTYHFALPKAAAYKGIRFSALGRSQEGTGSATVLLYDYKRNVFGVSATAGPGYGWYSTPSASGPDYIYKGSFASGVVIAEGSNGGSFDIAQVRLSYSYAVLR